MLDRMRLFVFANKWSKGRGLKSDPSKRVTQTYPDPSSDVKYWSMENGHSTIY